MKRSLKITKEVDFITMEIIPGILETDFSEIEKKLNSVSSFAKTVHIDIIDGSFASTRTFLDPSPFKKFSDEFFFELHMMVSEPITYLEPFAKAGFKRFLGNIEHMGDQKAFVEKAKTLGEVGIALDGKTPIDKINLPLTGLDCLLILAVDAGASGQPLNRQYAKKIEEVRTKNQSLVIEVDGGVTNQNIKSLSESGANRFVSTSFIFSGGNSKNRYQELSSALELA